MSKVYAVWLEVGAYEGEDVLCGVYASLIEAEIAIGEMQEDFEDYYVTILTVGKRCDFFGLKGELVK